MAGGKGGSQTTQVEIPEWVEEPAKRAIQRGEDISKIGYVPYHGPDVAAFSPSQEAAFANTNSAAQAFGLAAPTGTGLPQPETFRDGYQGYSARGLMNEAKGSHRRSNPAQREFIDSFFIRPVTGEMPNDRAGILGRFL